MRPRTHEDLADWVKQPESIVTVSAERLGEYPGVAMAFYAAAELAVSDKALGLRFEEGKLFLPKTEAELAELVREAQKTWDENAAKHRRALADPLSEEFDAQWKKNAVDNFAKAEGLPAVGWADPRC